MKNNIVAVVVTYNRKKLLLECISSLLKQEGISCDILIIDNKSTDGTELEIKSINNENIKYINTGINLGGAGGFNFGIRKAVEYGYEYIWLMDDDCIPTNTALIELKKTSEECENFGFLSSKVVWTDGSFCVMNVQKQSLYKKISFNVNKNIEILMATFVSCFIPAKIIKDVGLPIKEFFIWTDDLEYTRRITKKYKSFYVPNSIVVHKTSNNIGSDIAKSDINIMDRFFYRYRNEIFLYRREGISGWLYTLLKLVYHCFKILFLSKDNKLNRLKQLFKGTLYGLSFYPEIEKL